MFFRFDPPLILITLCEELQSLMEKYHSIEATVPESIQSRRTYRAEGAPVSSNHSCSLRKFDTYPVKVANLFCTAIV